RRVALDITNRFLPDFTAAYQRGIRERTEFQARLDRERLTVRELAEAAGVALNDPGRTNFVAFIGGDRPWLDCHGCGSGDSNLKINSAPPALAKDIIRLVRTWREQHTEQEEKR